MSKIKVAINGFGRIGRFAYKNLLEKNNVDVVAINDLTNPSVLAHLLKYDSAQGLYNKEVNVVEGGLNVDGRHVRITAEPNPGNLPWADMGVDVVIESTGRFLSRSDAGKHISAGAKKVILSAPANDKDIKTYVLGVNGNDLSANDDIISNASCTTNCLAPMVKILDEMLGIEEGLMATIHAYTADQQLVDAPHKDLRRSRAAAVNIIPTSTGAAKAVGLILPHLNGKLTGNAYRVPVPTGSITDFTCRVRKSATAEEINAAFRKAAEGDLKGILQFTDEPIVSMDIVGNKHSCIFDSDMTMVMGNLIKVAGWYDNEAGYSARLADITVKFGELVVEGVHA